MKQAVQKEGVRGVYKGMAAPLVMTGLVNSALFGMQFNLVGAMVAKKEGVNSDTPAAELQRRATTLDHCTAAVIGGSIISVLVTPMEGVKARLQVQYAAGGKGAGVGGVIYKGPWDCARRLINSELGWRRGLYRGWLPVCLCRMSNYAYFGSYTAISGAIGDRVGVKKGEKLPVGAALLAGGSAGFCYWLSCYPIDVVKARMQAAPDVLPPVYKGMTHAFKTIYRQEGYRAFFAGFTPCVLRAFPANAAAFVGFELALRALPEEL